MVEHRLTVNYYYAELSSMYYNLLFKLFQTVFVQKQDPDLQPTFISLDFQSL